MKFLLLSSITVFLSLSSAHAGQCQEQFRQCRQAAIELVESIPASVFAQMGYDRLSYTAKLVNECRIERQECRRIRRIACGNTECPE